MYSRVIATLCVALFFVSASVEAQSYYRRGDANFDGDVNLADVIVSLNGIFQAPPPCLEAADFDGDLDLNVVDVVGQLEYMFTQGFGPECPGPIWGRINAPPPCPGPGPCHPGVMSHQGDVFTDEVWESGMTHEIIGLVRVAEGATLTIMPGTTVLAEEGAALLVRPGSSIIACGTRKLPIVFASKDPCPKKGDWHGLYVLGEAPTNSFDPLITPVTEEFGGADPDHSSGVLKHVRIEHAGQEYPNGEIPPALNLLGVGRGTQVQNVLVKHSGGGGIQIRGGTVDLRYIAVEDCNGTAFDLTEGYQGRGQFWAARLAEEGEKFGLHLSNNPQGFDALPRTIPRLTNFVLIGDNASDTGILMDAGAGGLFDNGFVQGFQQAGLDIDDPATTFHGELIMDYVTFRENGQVFQQQDDELDHLFTSEEFFLFQGGIFDNSQNVDSAVEIMAAPFGFNGINPCVEASPDFTPLTFDSAGDPSLFDGWFELAQFRGAVHPELPDWTHDIWIGWD